MEPDKKVKRIVYYLSTGMMEEFDTYTRKNNMSKKDAIIFALQKLLNQKSAKRKVRHKDKLDYNKISVVDLPMDVFEQMENFKTEAFSRKKISYCRIITSAIHHFILHKDDKNEDE
jgi:hypothetical protein